MAIIDKIQLSGTVYTIGNETTTAVTSASTDNEIPTAKAVYDAIPQGGGGGESCTVDSTTMFYIFNHRYTNYGLDMRARYAVLDYGQHKTDTPNVSVEVNFRNDDYSTFVSKNINLDYSTSSYTLGDISQAEYIDVTYDSTIEDFKIAVATAYTSTVFIDYVNFSVGKIKVPFYTISSGSPCTAIENDIPTAISELGNIMIKGLKEVSISSQQNVIYVYNEKLGGDSSKRKIKLDEIDGSNSTLKPDIYVGFGTSGWTEINLSEQCFISNLKATKYRVTYNDSELDSYSMGLQFIVEYAENEVNSHITFDETYQPSLQTTDVFSAATLDWNASTRELVITYPETIELYGKQESVNISEINSNGCNFGQAITKLESYGEEKQALKSYVKETRAALGSKQDTLVSGTNIKTINGETLLGEGNITIQGGGSGGKAVSAGTNISITTGETADTINCTLPITLIKQGTSTFGDRDNLTIFNLNATNEIKHTGTTDNIIIGHSNKIGNNFDPSSNNFILGNYNNLNQGFGGNNPKFNFIVGEYNTIGKSYSENVQHTALFGTYLNPKNNYEYDFGKYNNSVSGSSTFGDSGNTLFSVGNGTADNARHNAFEVRQSGDIYIVDTNDTSTSNYWEKPMIKLQDALGGGGSSYTAGDGIDISNDVISVTGKVDTSAITTSVTSSSTDSQVPSAKAVYDIVGNIETLLSKI